MTRITPLLLVLTLVACARTPPTNPGARYAHARTRAGAADLAGAFAALEASLDAGYATPSDAVADPGFAPLLNADDLRPRVRTLLKAHARGSAITMVRPDEPGEPMRLTVTVVDGATGAPIPAVVIEFVHVDADGFYEPPQADGKIAWNPRLFGCAVTDEHGRVSVNTIRPGHYAPEYDAPDEAAHVHFNIESPPHGYRPFNAEFLLGDDPRLTEAVRRDAEQRGIPVAGMQRDDDGSWIATVSIPLRESRR